MQSLKKILYYTITGAAIALSSCKAKEEIQLEERVLAPVPLLAYSDPEQKMACKRQEYLEDILQEHKIPFVSDIIYFHSTNKEKYDKAMQQYPGIEEETDILWRGLKQKESLFSAVTILPRELIGKQKKSVIIAFPAAFETSRKEEDLLSYIIDHEGKHAEDHANGIMLCGKKITCEIIAQIGPQKYQDILELRAYGNQIEKMHLQQREVSEKFASKMLFAYFIAYRRVLNSCLKGNVYSVSAVQEAKYLPIINFETEELFLFEKKQPSAEEKK